MHWRFAAMTTSFIDLFLKPEFPISQNLVEFFLKGSISELPNLRKTSVQILSRIFLYIKTRALKRGSSRLKNIKRQINVPNPMPEGYTQSFLLESAKEVNKDQWNNNLYVGLFHPLFTFIISFYPPIFFYSYEQFIISQFYHFPSFIDFFFQ